MSGWRLTVKWLLSQWGSYVDKVYGRGKNLVVEMKDGKRVVFKSVEKGDVK